MLLEIAQPISLLLSILSLYNVFHAAFLVAASDPQQRIIPTLGSLAVAAALCMASGLVFCDAREQAGGPSTTILSTLPMRVFCSAVGAMLILFLISWYLETHCVFYRDVRRL